MGVLLKFDLKISTGDEVRPAAPNLTRRCLNGGNGATNHFRQRPCPKHDSRANGDIEKRGLSNLEFVGGSPRGNKHKADDDVRNHNEGDENVHERLERHTKKCGNAGACNRI